VASAAANFNRRQLVAGLCAAAVAPSTTTAAQSAPQTGDADWAARLVAAARAQIGVTVRYDPAYTRLPFPGGDVPRDKGVCTDVLIRAYRDAFGVDLQALVNADMRVAFASYPTRWGLAKPDPSIDHRRVLNLRIYLQRRGFALGSQQLAPAAFDAGDIATQVLPGNLPHIGVVSDKMGADGRRLLIHNIGSGTEETDVLASYPLTGRYRFAPA
jgi:uncharacterized protein